METKQDEKIQQWNQWLKDTIEKSKRQEELNKRNKSEIIDLERFCLPFSKQLRFKQQGEERKDLRQHKSIEMQIFLKKYYNKLEKTRQDKFSEVVQKIWEDENDELYKRLGDENFEDQQKREEIKETLKPSREKKFFNLMEKKFSDTIRDFYQRNGGQKKLESITSKPQPLDTVNEKEELNYEKEQAQLNTIKKMLKEKQQEEAKLRINPKQEQQKQLTTLRTLNNFFTKKQIRANKDKKLQQQLTNEKLNFYF